ncbi:MAG: hypothetical protein ABSH05_21990 [Bryobacteraceae bacterium]|jgi:hypothetical protein
MSSNHAGQHVPEFRNVRSRAQFQARTDVVRRSEALCGLPAGGGQAGEWRGIDGHQAGTDPGQDLGAVRLKGVDAQGELSRAEQAYDSLPLGDRNAAPKQVLVQRDDAILRSTFRNGGDVRIRWRTEGDPGDQKEQSLIAQAASTK